MKGETIALGVLGLMGLGWILTREKAIPTVTGEPEAYIMKDERGRTIIKTEQEEREGDGYDGDMVLDGSMTIVTTEEITESGEVIVENTYVFDTVGPKIGIVGVADWNKGPEDAITYRDITKDGDPDRYMDEPVRNPESSGDAYKETAEIDTSRAEEPEPVVEIKNDGSIAVQEYQPIARRGKYTIL